MAVTLQVSATGRQGDGIAWHDSRKLFIPAALAGDTVSVELDAPGNLINSAILQPGPAHAVPPCSHFPICGGCKMQHMALGAYAEWKRQFVLNALAANDLPPANVAPPHFSPPQSRRRATFAAQRQGKRVILGFNQARSHQIVDLQMCSVLRPELTALLPALRLMLAGYMGEAKQLDLRLTLLDGVIDLVIIGGPEPALREREILGSFAAAHNIGRINWRKWDKSADEPIVQRLPLRAQFPHGVVALPPGGFLQATAEGEQALQQAVATAIGSAALVADLFCGIGTFTLALNPRPLTAVDGDGAAINALRQTLQGRSKTTVATRNLVREPLTDTELKDFKAVILDPPRDGAKAQAQQLAASKVPLVVSVSCDLNSFCRDGKILQAGGYHLESLSIVDQFLWSTHVELVGVFRR